jgi:predicted phosphodiesterase
VTNRIARGSNARFVGALTVALALAACGSRDTGNGAEAVPDSFVPSVNAERAVVWAVGDGANGSDEARAVADRIAADRVDRLLYLGDVYESGTSREFELEYDSVYGDLAQKTAPTAGNHDWENRNVGYRPYWFAVHLIEPPDWYWFRAGGWSILSLNSEAPHGRGSPQERWLRQQVREPGTCRIAFWHRARHSAGDIHGDQEDMQPLWEAVRGRAAIVLAGHEHNMQRFRPIDGITEFVSGAGGRVLYRLKKDSRLAFGNDREFGALRLDLSPGVARHAFVNADGEVLDRGTVRCRP